MPRSSRKAPAPPSPGTAKRSAFTGNLTDTRTSMPLPPPRSGTAAPSGRRDSRESHGERQPALAESNQGGHGIARELLPVLGKGELYSGPRTARHLYRDGQQHD